MKVFVTGGAGYVGAPIVRELARAGHDVTALTRRAQHDALVRSLGAAPLRGDLHDASSWHAAASRADAIVHLAVPSDGAAVLDALLRVTSHRLVVYTSVLFVLGNTPSGNSEASEPSGDLYADRAACERKVLAAEGAVIRPGMVYGGGAGGTVSELFRTAMGGRARYVGNGENRWSLVQRDDVAALFRIVIENGARGIFHAVDEEPLAVSEVASIAAAMAGHQVTESIPLDDARAALGRFADALSLDQPSCATRSRAFGWRPSHRSFRTAAAAAFADYAALTAPSTGRTGL